MHYVCKYCGPTGEWHYEHAHRKGCMVPVATRDDLIRLVVGMQWREAIVSLCAIADAGYVSANGDVDDIVSMSSGFDDIHRPAVDIVDEWLGVR
jgi:hypothetical protein